MAVMFSLLGALNEVSQYMNFREYYEMYNEYNAAVVEYTDFDDATVAALKEQGVISDERKDASGATVSYEIQYAQKAVYDFYQENKTSFLWINNIWSPDVPWKKEVNDFKQFTANIGKYGTDAKKSGLSDTELADMKTKYNTVMGLLLDEENNGANGYLVLPILSVLLSVGMQLITMRQQKKSGQMNDAMGGGGAMKVMMFVMPVMIGFFSLSYTSAFSLYLVVNYVFSLIINVGSNIILYGIDRHEKKKLETEVHKYGRPDPNDFNK